MSSAPGGGDFETRTTGEGGGDAVLEAQRAERPNFLTATRFTDFDLPPEIMAGVDQAGFEYCTPIQAQAIPVAMNGLDIAGQAQTGTGKTTAFLIPLLQRLMKNKPLEPNVPRAIIVTPTRELALQIHEDALILAGSTNLRQALVIGGIDYREQAELLGTAPEIVICTPGRIIDYMQQGVFKTRGIEVAVVDEADRLLDMGFIKDLKYLLGHLPPYTQRQTMLFSATLDERVLELTYQFMNPPQFITAEPDKTAKLNIEQELYHVGREEKLSLLIGLLRREPHRRVIIFSNTKSGVEWLAKKLAANGFQAEGITGDLPQPKRLKLMEAFKENRLQILVATDVASRGIHVEDVSHVYNYDLPQDAENYVHRIGRTARAGREGKAVSFGCEDYVFHLEAIENLLGEKIPVCWAGPECFLSDQGGEVRLKERGGRGRQKAAGPGRGGGSGRDRDREEREHGPGRPAGRSPARSQRSGGIFGLAPRLTGDPAADERRRLGWAAEPLPEALAAVDEEAAPEAPETPEAAPEENAREGNRRRRRRGRGRGRGREGVTATEPPETSAGEEREPEQPPAAETRPEPPPAPELQKAEEAVTETPAAAPGKRKSRAAPKTVPAKTAEAPPEPPETKAEAKKKPRPRKTAPAAAEAPAAEAPAPKKRGRPKKNAAEAPPEEALEKAPKKPARARKAAKTAGPADG